MQDPLRAIKSTQAQKSAISTGSHGSGAALLEDSLELRKLQQQLEYPHRLSFYQAPPTMEVSMEEFETFALDRLHVLKSLESAMLRNRADADLQRMLKEVQAKHLPFTPTMAIKSGVSVDADRRKDYISHFILRLAFCRSDDLQQWFVRYETMLFRHRWEMCTREERDLFLSGSHLQLKPISAQEKAVLEPSLVQSSVSLSIAARQTMGDAFDSGQFFKVPFELVPDLVSRREVYLQDGFAFVPQQSIISVILADFKQTLFSALRSTAKALPRLDDDHRLKPLLNNMSNQYLGKDYANVDSATAAGQITHTDIDKLVAHFPPCMRHLQDQLRREQHLKHFGRMQYGLFLKGIGLSLDEALIYWRKAFGKLTDDQFQRGGYAYNIRHNYGQEGKRTNYTPYSCMKIITTSQPSSGDHHGCPFKHFGKENLKGLLMSHGLSSEDVQAVVDTMASGPHYQIACTKYFECSRGKKDTQDGQPQLAMVDTINHPNHFFDMSVKLAGGLDTMNDKKDDGQPKRSMAMEVDR